jgi:hypothetical protein
MSKAWCAPELEANTISRRRKSMRMPTLPPPGVGIGSVTRPSGRTFKLMCHHLGWKIAWDLGTEPTAFAQARSVARVGS